MERLRSPAECPGLGARTLLPLARIMATAVASHSNSPRPAHRADHVGARVSHFMNKFREAGFIDYNGHLEVHSSLLSVVLAEQPRTVRLPQ